MEPDVLGGDTDLLEMSVLYADDNVDHNHLYRSKFIVDTFHKMGFCFSTTEVMRFLKSGTLCGT